MARSHLCLLALAACLLSAAPSRAADPAPAPKTPASENPCVKYMPDDAWLIGSIDVKSGLKWAAESKLIAGQRELIAQYARLTQMVSGVDPAKEIDCIALFATGAPEKDPAYLIAVSGTFTTATVERTISEQLETEIEKVDTKNMYTAGGASFAFPEAGMMLIGRTDLVKAAIGKAKAKINTPKLLADTLARTDAASLAWVAVRPKVILDHSLLETFRKENPDLTKRLAALEFVALSVAEVEDGYVLTATSSFAKPEDAADFRAYLNDRKAALLHKEGVSPIYLPLLAACTVGGERWDVGVKMEITGRTFKQVLGTKAVLKGDTPR